MQLRLICTDKTLVDGPGYLAAGQSYRVGRSSRCSFVIGDRSVSRYHAEVTVTEEAVRLRDLGSRNGTFVDDKRVGEAEVQPGQWLRFGSAQFQLLGHDEAEEFSKVESELSTFFVRSTPSLQPAAVKLLSKAQLGVLDLLLTGLQEKEVAADLGISPHTVHMHVKEIYRRMGVSSRPELLSLFVANPKKQPKSGK